MHRLHRRGSALVMALWIILVLSIMVLSFATEAHLQAGVNVYVRERNRVNRLMDAGRVIGEVVLAGYGEAKEWEEGEDEEELLEDDRWYREKRDLKTASRCKIGPILLDEDDPDSGTVTVEISLANSGDKNGININQLYSEGDQNYELRWRMILQSHGINEEIEVPDRKGRKVNLVNMLIASWNDWRDKDDTSTAISGDECGAEAKWYEEDDDDLDTPEEDRRRPRNEAIPDIQELAYVRGFKDYPAVLTGGLLLPDEDESEDNPRVTGIVDLFGVTGSTKINVNDCTVEQLLTVPGIFDEDDDDQEESKEVAQAIVDTLKIKPDYDVDETRDWWPYKDWQDLCQRVDDAFSVQIDSDANQYLAYGPDASTIFKMKITGSSMGMKHEATCECYVRDKKVRYVKWRED